MDDRLNQTRRGTHVEGTHWRSKLRSRSLRKTGRIMILRRNRTRENDGLRVRRTYIAILSVAHCAYF